MPPVLKVVPAALAPRLYCFNESKTVVAQPRRCLTYSPTPKGTADQLERGLSSRLFARCSGSDNPVVDRIS